MKCAVCGREAINQYCKFHEEAYRNVAEKFEAWQRAMDISWKEYLKELVENPYTGSWAKEVAEHQLKKTGE